MRKCERITRGSKTEYRYGCDVCADALMKTMGGVVKAGPREHVGFLYCPYDECPYAAEIKRHSRSCYEEYDKYVRTKWSKVLGEL